MQRIRLGIEAFSEKRSPKGISLQTMEITAKGKKTKENKGGQNEKKIKGKSEEKGKAKGNKWKRRIPKENKGKSK
jgi:hypothetical protein